MLCYLTFAVILIDLLLILIEKICWFLLFFLFLHLAAFWTFPLSPFYTHGKSMIWWQSIWVWNWAGNVWQIFLYWLWFIKYLPHLLRCCCCRCCCCCCCCLNWFVFVPFAPYWCVNQRKLLVLWKRTVLYRHFIDTLARVFGNFFCLMSERYLLCTSLTTTAAASNCSNRGQTFQSSAHCNGRENLLLIFSVYFFLTYWLY